MKLKLLYLLSVLLFACSENPGKSSTEPQGSKDSQNESANTSEKATNAENDPFMVPTPEGYYEPQGLKKLNVLEMYKLGTGGEFTKDFPIKDKSGNAVGWNIMEDPAKPMFMQIYVDENGTPKEGVVYEINDEIRALIMKVRMTTNQ